MWATGDNVARAGVTPAGLGAFGQGRAAGMAGSLCADPGGQAGRCQRGAGLGRDPAAGGGDKVAQKKSCSTGMTANAIRKPAYSILIALQKALASAFAVSSILACCAVQSE